MDYDDLSYSTAEELSNGKAKRAAARQRNLANKNRNDGKGTQHGVRKAVADETNYDLRRVKRLTDIPEED